MCPQRKKLRGRFEQELIGRNDRIRISFVRQLGSRASGVGLVGAGLIEVTRGQTWLRLSGTMAPAQERKAVTLALRRIVAPSPRRKVDPSFLPPLVSDSGTRIDTIEPGQGRTVCSPWRQPWESVQHRNQHPNRGETVCRAPSPIRPTCVGTCGIGVSVVRRCGAEAAKKKRGARGPSYRAR